MNITIILTAAFILNSLRYAKNLKMADYQIYLIALICIILILVNANSLVVDFQSGVADTVQLLGN